MTRLFLLVLGFTAAPVAGAGPVSVGIGVGTTIDLPDKVSRDYARFSPGAALRIPVVIELSEAARLRVIPRVDLAIGTDRVAWTQYVDGEPVRFYDDVDFAMVLGAGITLGADAVVPGDLPITPYLGGDIGGAWVGTYHSLDEESAILLDPTQNDLDDPNNIDPYTTQLALVTELHVGLRRRFGERLDLWFEMGYSVAFLGRTSLKKAPADLDPTREPFGYNAVGLGLGISIAL